MCNCHSILECCVMFFGVKLSIRSLNLFMSCYLFTFSNTCFILNTSYFFDILPITFRYFLTFLKDLLSFRYFLTFLSLHTSSKTLSIVLGALWFLKHANFLRLVFLYFPPFRKEATILRSKNCGLLFNYHSPTWSF